jgi:hypothetical protein
VIRQAISCDICGSEKRQAKNWFVAWDEGEELRLSGWNSCNQMSPAAKHLCGQTCLHKLVDEFMAREMARELEARTQIPLAQAMEQPRVLVEAVDTSLTSDAAYDDFESSARLISIPVELPLPAAIVPRPAALRPPLEMFPAAASGDTVKLAPPPEEAPRFATPNWRAEAWEREREREQHAVASHSGIAVRRRFNG